jgi:hypothetical protein
LIKQTEYILLNPDKKLIEQIRGYLMKIHWSGMRESNPHLDLGKVTFYH